MTPFRAGIRKRQLIWHKEKTGDLESIQNVEEPKRNSTHLGVGANGLYFKVYVLIEAVPTQSVTF